MALSKQRVIVDTSFFVALFNPQDSLHARALRDARALESAHFELYISNYIFLEVVTVLSQRRGKTVGLNMGTYLRRDPRVHYIPIDKALDDAVWEIFRAVTSKNISYVDCSTLALIRHTGIHTLLTYDSADFKKLQKITPFEFFTA